MASKTYTVYYSGSFDVTIGDDDFDPGMTEDEVRDRVLDAESAEHERAGRLEFNARERNAVIKWAAERSAQKAATED